MCICICVQQHIESCPAHMQDNVMAECVTHSNSNSTLATVALRIIIHNLLVTLIPAITNIFNNMHENLVIDILMIMYSQLVNLKKSQN
jgi:hypothetical protein